MGRTVTEEVKQELWEALGDSPIGATLGCMSYLVGVYYYYYLRYNKLGLIDFINSSSGGRRI